VLAQFRSISELLHQSVLPLILQRRRGLLSVGHQGRTLGSLVGIPPYFDLANTSRSIHKVPIYPAFRPASAPFHSLLLAPCLKPRQSGQRPGSLGYRCYIFLRRLVVESYTKIISHFFKSLLSPFNGYKGQLTVLQ